MKKSNDFRRGRNCVFNMHVHLVFVAKYRKLIFTEKLVNDLRKIFHDICEDFEAHLIEINGEKDHIHLLVNYPPKVSVSKLVNSLKGVSSRLLRKKKHPNIEEALWGNALWSPSYFASSCGGGSLEMIKTYIKNQGK